VNTPCPLSKPPLTPFLVGPPSQEFQAFGSPYGARVLSALYDAAARGVQMRVLNDNGTIGGPPAQLLTLQAAYPEQVGRACFT
jgi:hypothetical protein